MQAVVIGFTNLVFTLIAMSMIDRVGRTKLLLAGAVGTAVSLAGVAMLFATGKQPKLLLWLLVGFVAFFAFSQGAPSFGFTSAKCSRIWFAPKARASRASLIGS